MEIATRRALDALLHTQSLYALKAEFLGLHKEPKDSAEILSIIATSDPRLKVSSDLVPDLVMEIVQDLSVTDEDVLGWIDRVSEAGGFYGHWPVVQLVTKYVKYRGPIRPGRVVRWAKEAEGDRDFKAAAMLLMNTGYTTATHVPTLTLCQWVEHSTDRYDDNHGVFRLIGLLLKRLNGPVRHKMRARASQAFVTVLVNLHGHGFEFDTACRILQDHLKPSRWERIRHHAEIRIREAYEDRLSTIHTSLNRPATPP